MVGERSRLEVAAELDEFLAAGGVENVQLAQDTADPPMMAYLTQFPRLTVTLRGQHTMLIARDGQSAVIRPAARSVLYLPANCWNLPDWSEPVCDLTFLFGKQHVGVSLVDHPGVRADRAPSILKTSLHRDRNGLLQHLLGGLAAAAGMVGNGEDDLAASAGLMRSTATAVLHAVSHLLAAPPPGGNYRARRMYEAMRLHIEESAHLSISRDSVAAHFGLTPNHVSRLFRQEGDVGFNETLNLARVNRAKSMLGKYGTPLKEVAQHCGFTTTAYFCRTFKKLTSRTPTEYRLKAPRLRGASRY